MATTKAYVFMGLKLENVYLVWEGGGGEGEAGIDFWWWVKKYFIRGVYRGGEIFPGGVEDEQIFG